MLKVARWRSASRVPTNPNQRLVAVVVAAAVELAVVEAMVVVVVVVESLVVAAAAAVELAVVEAMVVAVIVPVPVKAVPVPWESRTFVHSNQARRRTSTTSRHGSSWYFLEQNRTEMTL